MTEDIIELIEEKKVTNLRELSEKIKVPYTKLRNISCGRVRFESLFKIKRRHEVSPKRSGDLAEIIGIVLGDGNILKLKRCQRLVISCDRKHPGKTTEIKNLIHKIFKKEPKIYRRSKVNCDDVCLYMQNIDKALGLKAGSKIRNKVKIPKWVLKNKKFLVRCLKGLFETDGNYSENKKFYVQFIEFENRCKELKLSAYKAIKSLGYNPQLGNRYVRLARRREVADFIKRIKYFKCQSLW
ncbi:MAG: hypothetical protein ABH843_01440 [Candidatus Omnitrophota bacterium]